jgi:hypothetical protein
VSSLTNRGPSYGDNSYLQQPYFIKQMDKLTGQTTTGTSNNGSSKLATEYNSSHHHHHLHHPFICSKSLNKFGLKRLKVESSSCDIQMATNGDEGGTHAADTPLPKCGVGHNHKPLHPVYFKNTSSSSDGSPNSRLFIETTSDSNDNVLSARSTTSNSNFTTTSVQQERLILMPEEAIFLSFGVGCLIIQTVRGESLGYRTVWRKLVENDPEFPISYAVYHYFRAKNWVPKLGDSYGASYGK